MANIWTHDATVVQRSHNTRGKDNIAVKLTVAVHPPPALSSEYWATHGITMVDADHIFGTLPAAPCWMMAALHGSDVPASAVKPGVTTEAHVTGKTTALRRLLKAQRYVFAETPPRLLKLGDTIFVPTYTVDKQLMDDARRLLVTGLSITVDNVVTGVVTYMHKMWLPTGEQDSYIILTRLVRKSEWRPRGSTRAHQMPRIVCADGRGYVLGEEAVAVMSIDN